jgi:uncharacterized repeat protein (TIGR04076 family)
MSEDKWFEPMRFEIAVIEVKSECRVNHRVGETFRAEYRTPDVPICGEAYVGMYPLVYAMRLGGDMRNLGKQNPLETTYTCPSGVVRYQIRGIPQCNKCGKAVESLDTLIRILDPYPMDVCAECQANYEANKS